MYSFIFAVLSVFLAYYTTFSAAASADCLRQIGFPANSQRYSTFTNASGVTCIRHSKLDNRTCTWQETYKEVDLSTTLNITTKYDVDVFDTFAQSFNVSFHDVNYSSSHLNGTVSSDSVESEDSPDAEVTPVLSGNSYGGSVFPQRCYIGEIVKDCFNDIPTGTRVKACRPFIPDEGEDEPSDLEDEIVRPGEVVTPTRTGVITPTARPTNSGAVHLLDHAGWRSSLLTVAMMATIMKIGNYLVTC